MEFSFFSYLQNRINGSLSSGHIGLLSVSAKNRICWLWFRYSVKYVYCNNPERDLTIVTIGATYGRNRIDKKNSDRSSTPFGVDVLYS
ncbi:MAG: hypothetical protein K8R54_04845 [Bacteroidales bacterium]|nr:hypothetical protein [Bacteroidales bacterium]